MSQTNTSTLTVAQEQFLLLNISDAIPAPVFYKDVSLKYIGCNKAFEYLFQKTREDIRGKTVFDLYPDLPEKAKKIHDRDRAFLASDETRYTYENNLVDPTGKKRHLIVTKAKFHHPDGSLAGLVAIMFDNTEQKQAEEALQKEQIFLRTLMDAIPDPILYKDTKLKYLDCNKAFEVFAGGTREKLIGGNAFDFFPRERAQRITDWDTKFMQSSDRQTTYEIALPYKGEIRDFVITKTKFYDSKNTVGGFATTIFDITDRKKLEQNLLHSNQKLRDNNEQILAGINYASRIQNAILVEKDIITKHFKEAFVYFRPKDIVSGDFYWFARKGNILLIAAADCTGHGVPGALMTVLGNGLLNQIVYEQGLTQPDKILEALDIKWQHALHQRNLDKQITDGAELALCAIDLKKRKIQFSGAKRPLWYLRNGEIKELDGSKFSVGGKSPKKKKVFKLHKINIHKNDVFYLFTDGFSDQLGIVHGRRFMTKNLKKLLEEAARLPLEKQSERLEKELKIWMGDFPQTDDILIMGIKVV